jgi:hypothetical protein
MGAREKRPAPENITTAISRFHGIKHMRSPEAGDHFPAKPTGGLNLPLVRLDPRHGGLDPDTGRLDSRHFQPDKRHFRADVPQFRSAEQGGGPKGVRVRLNQQGVAMEMSVVESDARESQSAEQDVRLNVANIESRVSGFQSDVSESHFTTSQVESDEPLVGLK